MQTFLERQHAVKRETRLRAPYHHVAVLERYAHCPIGTPLAAELKHRRDTQRD